jgi:hypothetical protein
VAIAQHKAQSTRRNKAMSSYWEATAREASVEGSALEFNGKTLKWTIDKEEIPVGDDQPRWTVLMPTALVGWVLFEKGRPPQRRVGLADSFQPPKEMPKDWNLSTSVLLVDDNGAMVTFSSSNLGGRRAFDSLAGPYYRLGMNAFPIVTLGSKDVYYESGPTKAPTLRIIGWRDRQAFSGLGLDHASPPPLALEGPAEEEAKPAVEPGPPRLTDDPADDIPF